MQILIAAANSEKIPQIGRFPSGLLSYTNFWICFSCDVDLDIVLIEQQSSYAKFIPAFCIKFMETTFEYNDNF